MLRYNLSVGHTVVGLAVTLAVGSASAQSVFTEIAERPTPRTEYQEVTKNYTTAYLDYLEKTAQLQELKELFSKAKKHRESLSERALKKEIKNLKRELEKMNETLRKAVLELRSDGNQLLAKVKSVNRFLKSHNRLEFAELYSLIDDTTTFIRKNASSRSKWKRLSDEEVSAILAEVGTRFENVFSSARDGIQAELVKLKADMDSEAQKVQIEIDPIHAEIERIEALEEFVKWSTIKSRQYRRYQNASSAAESAASAASQAESEYSSLVYEKSAIESRLSSYSGWIADAQARQSSARSAMSDASSRISNLQSRQSDLESRLSQVQARCSSISFNIISINRGRGGNGGNGGVTEEERKRRQEERRRRDVEERRQRCMNRAAEIQNRLSNVSSRISNAESDYSSAQSELSSAESEESSLYSNQSADESRSGTIDSEISTASSNASYYRSEQSEQESIASAAWSKYSHAKIKFREVKRANSYDEKVAARRVLIRKKSKIEGVSSDSLRQSQKIDKRKTETEQSFVKLNSLHSRRGELPAVIAEKERVLTVDLPQQQADADAKIESLKTSYAGVFESMSALDGAIAALGTSVVEERAIFVQTLSESGQTLPAVAVEASTERWAVEKVGIHPAFDRAACIAHGDEMISDQSMVARMEIAGLKKEASAHSFSEATILLETMVPTGGVEIPRATKVVMSVYRQNPRSSRRRTVAAIYEFSELAAVAQSEGSQLKQVFGLSFSDRKKALRDMKRRWIAKLDFVYGGQVVATIPEFSFAGVTAALKNEIGSSSGVCKIKLSDFGKYKEKLK